MPFCEGLAKEKELEGQGTDDEIPRELEPPTSADGMLVLQVHCVH